MITVRIGATERVENSPSDFDSGWINQEIRAMGQSQDVCVKVTIDEPPINMVLATPGCPSSGGAHRQANDDEQRIFDIWDQCDLKQSRPDADGVLGFLHRLRNVL
jgi:hypothetical protein